MSIEDWEKHTITADIALQNKDFLRSVLHYQQALTVSEQLEKENIDIEELLTINIVSCHNLANFWRIQEDSEYELKYLQLASEKMLTLVPQCPNRSCDAFLDSLGCCRKALIGFMKRHPNPAIAKQVQHIDTATHCGIIAKFNLH
ncbi:DUF2753 family protein [Vibrio sp. HN007]|uniref:DUF2753 family protein n=1 Tax=Vibrio iocasae TaxID=3098914 RepID=UPI0035D5245A